MVQAKQKEQMTSRERILEAVKKNQPAGIDAPELKAFPSSFPSAIEKFKTVLVTIGGAVIEVSNQEAIAEYVARNFPEAKRIVNLTTAAMPDPSADPHLLENVDLAILPGAFGVAENGAVWITDEKMGDRALPFICANLALVVRQQDIIPTLHQAYERIGTAEYNLGTFIAGPSKTADIEQSLVLGAHGPKSMTVFLLGE
jgi:L-lactate dehydrogenase complex protein LldG